MSLLFIAILAAVLTLVDAASFETLGRGKAHAASWERQWDELVAAAKKEGRLVLFGSTDAPPRVQIPAAFKDRFGITIEYLGGRGGEIASRIIAEQQAGQYYFDVVIAGTTAERLLEANMLDPIRPLLIHPEASDASRWRTNGLFFLDPQQQYIMRLSMYVATLRAINTAYVKPEEASWEGLLHPRWKEKVATLDPRVSGAGQGQATYILHSLGEDYFTKLYLGQRVVLARENRQVGDWIARGTHPITIGMPGGEFQRLKEQGFPIINLPTTKEVPGYTTAGRGYVSLVKRAPHPNAAKLFLNWLTTKDGHTVYNRAAGAHGTRSDLDYPWVPQGERLQPGWNYIDTDTPDYRTNVEPKLLNRMMEILK